MAYSRRGSTLAFHKYDQEQTLTTAVDLVSNMINHISTTDFREVLHTTSSMGIRERSIFIEACDVLLSDSRMRHRKMRILQLRKALLS